MQSPVTCVLVGYRGRSARDYDSTIISRLSDSTGLRVTDVDPATVHEHHSPCLSPPVPLHFGQCLSGLPGVISITAYGISFMDSFSLVVYVERSM